MEKEILEKIEESSKKLDAIYASIEKTRKYFLWTLIINAVVIILPFLALLIVIPWFLKSVNVDNLTNLGI